MEGRLRIFAMLPPPAARRRGPVARQERPEVKVEEREEGSPQGASAAGSAPKQPKSNQGGKGEIGERKHGCGAYLSQNGVPRRHRRRRYRPRRHRRRRYHHHRHFSVWFSF